LVWIILQIVVEICCLGQPERGREGGLFINCSRGKRERHKTEIKLLLALGSLNREFHSIEDLCILSFLFLRM